MISSAIDGGVIPIDILRKRSLRLRLLMRVMMVLLMPRIYYISMIYIYLVVVVIATIKIPILTYSVDIVAIGRERAFP